MAGRRRALGCRDPLTLKQLRGARPEDAEFVWRVRMEPDVRKSSRRQEALQFAEYARDFTHDLSDVQCQWWIIVEELPVGYVNVRHGEISVALIGSARGRGLGVWAIREATRRARERPLHAIVRNGNDGSLRAFRAAGYAVIDDDGVFFTLSST